MSSGHDDDRARRPRTPDLDSEARDALHLEAVEMAADNHVSEASAYRTIMRQRALPAPGRRWMTDSSYGMMMRKASSGGVSSEAQLALGCVAFSPMRR